MNQHSLTFQTLSASTNVYLQSPPPPPPRNIRNWNYLPDSLISLNLLTNPHLSPNHPKPLQNHPKPPHNTFKPSQSKHIFSNRKPDILAMQHSNLIIYCNEQPSQATANPVSGKACSSTKGGLLRYIPNTYSNHKVSSF